MSSWRRRQHGWLAAALAVSAGILCAPSQGQPGKPGHDVVAEPEPFPQEQTPASERKAIVAKLVNAMRRLNLATPAAERSKLIAELLKDDLWELRLLGIELAARELAAANTLGPEVSQRTIVLLKDPSPELRAAAAGLLAQLSRVDAKDALYVAMKGETDFAAAAAMLKLACRWPEESLVPTTLAWLGKPSPGVEGASLWRGVRDAAVDLSWNLLRAGELNPEGAQQAVLAAARGIPTAELGPSGCLLLSWLGDASDRTKIGELLLSSDAGQRLAAAESLVVYEEYLEPILRAAALDSQLIDLAVRGVILHRQTLAGFEGLAAITASKPDLRRATLSRVARFLRATDVLAAAATVRGEPIVREVVLADLARPERILSERVSDEQKKAIESGLEELAKLRLEMDKPGGAVAAIDAIETLGPAPEAAVLLKAKAFIRLNRPEDAELLHPPAMLWLETLGEMEGRPNAVDILEFIDARIAPQFDEEQLARLEQMRTKVVGTKKIEPATPR